MKIGMKLKLSILGLVLFGLIYVGFSTNTLSCTVRDNSCVSPEVPFFYANNHFSDTSGNGNNDGHS